jgi:hypothetical protein
MDAPQSKTPAGGPGQFDAAQQSLFDEPPAFCPQWPNPATLPDKALDRLIAGERLTHPKFQARTGSWRLAAAIKVLRWLGWPIQTDELHRPGRRPIADYWLPPDFVQAIKGGPRHE